MLFKKTLLAVAALAFVGAAAAAPASNPATATFQVKMTIQKACSVTAGSTSDINLGTVESTAINQTGNNTISITCSKTTPYTIGLLPTTTGGTANGTGFMISTTAPLVNTDKVPYSLYSDSGNTTSWGNTIGTNRVSSAGTGAAKTHTVYAKNIDANYTPDSYADTVTVSVSY